MRFDSESSQQRSLSRTTPRRFAINRIREDTMIVGLLQYDPTYLEVEKNLGAVGEFLSDSRADLIVLPELFATGYSFKSADDLDLVAEAASGGPTITRMIQWSRDSGAVIVGGFPERDESGRIFNSAAITSPDGLVGVYRKVHLFYKEKTLFAPGDLGFPVFDVADRSGASYRLGVMICFDWYFPEAARSLSLSGADVIAHPSNLVRKDCPRAMPIRALENHVYTITSNRTGTEYVGDEALTFIGQSVACSPAGDELQKFGSEENGYAEFEIDPTSSRDRDITSMNNLFTDRRTDLYRLD